MTLTTLIASAIVTTAAATDTISTPAVVSVVRQRTEERMLPSPVSSVYMGELTSAAVTSQTRLSGIIPNLHIPEYGSSMTSSIYVRGLGSRMESPVMGLYIDDIPVLDKNAYDTGFLDLRRVQVLRGPQGTLYGRNSMCGVLALHTLSPTDWQGWRGAAEYGSAGSLRASLSAYTGRHSIAVGIQHCDGWWRNSYDGHLCDPRDSYSIRWRYEGPLDGPVSISNILSASWTDEGAFAYGRLVDGVLLPVSYNDEGSYRRLTVLEGFKLHRDGERTALDFVGSLQALADDMRMDQDFTSADIFTLRQRERSAAATAELILRPRESYGHWHRSTGVFAFFRYNSMYAPVVFKREGIEQLIIAGANSGIPASIGRLEIDKQTLRIPSDFGLWSWNAAAYHESSLSLGRWHFTLGARLDYEGGAMDYDSRSEVSFSVPPTFAAVRQFDTRYRGSITHSYWELLPKAAVLYDVSPLLERGHMALYANAAKGYRAGGFNTQIFSDILQYRMMNGMMDRLGVHFVNPMESVGAGNTDYLPEDAWNYEVGVRYGSGRLTASGSAYLIDCMHQQLTVFPPGKSTGRMMTNAGRSRSVGTEVEAAWRADRFETGVSWGWNSARFVRYADGQNDYGGKRVPYSPAHTLYLSASYRWPLSISQARSLSISADCRGTGPIFWDEANSRRQGFYALPGARVALTFDRFEIYCRGDNLGDRAYNVFYFKSVGNEFCQRGRPRAIYAGITFNL